jgi:hypothetical protein
LNYSLTACLGSLICCGVSYSGCFLEPCNLKYFTVHSGNACCYHGYCKTYEVYLLITIMFPLLRFRFFLCVCVCVCGGRNGAILALTQTCAPYVNMNNFGGCLFKRNVFYLYQFFLSCAIWEKLQNRQSLALVHRFSTVDIF